MRKIVKPHEARNPAWGLRDAVDPKQGGGAGRSGQAGSGGAAGNIAPRIARLAARGLEPAEIALELGIPEERVAAGSLGATDAAPDDLGETDKVVADSFPASDPPPGPAA